MRYMVRSYEVMAIPADRVVRDFETHYLALPEWVRDGFTSGRLWVSLNGGLYFDSGVGDVPVPFEAMLVRRPDGSFTAITKDSFEQQFVRVEGDTSLAGTLTRLKGVQDELQAWLAGQIAR